MDVLSSAFDYWLAWAGLALVDCKFRDSREETPVMSKVCDVCGKGPQFGHRVSHAHNVSKRRWNVNLQKVRAIVNGAAKRLRVCTACIRSGKVQKAA